MHDRRLQELRLYTDFGRCSRPLFIVSNQELLIKKDDIRKLLMYETDEERLTWRKLIEQGYIEYVLPFFQPDISLYHCVVNSQRSPHHCSANRVRADVFSADICILSCCNPGTSTPRRRTRR